MIPAIVLAGGAGTRLSSVVSEVPKPMAPINGRPFLEILIDHLINAGVYLVERSLFRVAPPAPRFSFETDVMQRHCSSVMMRGLVTDAMFIDIGVPEEFLRAQTLLQ